MVFVSLEVSSQRSISYITEGPLILSVHSKNAVVPFRLTVKSVGVFIVVSAEPSLLLPLPFPLLSLLSTFACGVV